MFDRVPVCGTLLLLYGSNGAAELVCAHFVTSTRRMVHSCWIRELDTVLERNEKIDSGNGCEWVRERKREKWNSAEIKSQKFAMYAHYEVHHAVHWFEHLTTWAHFSLLFFLALLSLLSLLNFNCVFIGINVDRSFFIHSGKYRKYYVFHPNSISSSAWNSTKALGPGLCMKIERFGWIEQYAIDPYQFVEY